MWSTENASLSFSGFNLTRRTGGAPEHDSGSAAQTRGSQPAQNVIAQARRNQLIDGRAISGSTNAAVRRSRLAAACRWLAIGSCLTLCAPVLLFSFFLFGFLLLPLLPLIGASLVVPIGGSPSAPPARPTLPSAAAAPTLAEYSEAA